ncbi:hypothetical protein, partial [Acinetobacter baumannii]|uniref:hypothetical protein n=1 Tax=Acinetobacter baumannii TaxID=470 RepID=UPI001C06E36B
CKLWFSCRYKHVQLDYSLFFIVKFCNRLQFILGDVNINGLDVQARLRLRQVSRSQFPTLIDGVMITMHFQMKTDM